MYKYAGTMSSLSVSSFSLGFDELVARQHHGRQIIHVAPDLCRGRGILRIVRCDGCPLQRMLQIARVEAADLLIVPLLPSNRVRQQEVDGTADRTPVRRLIVPKV